MNIFAATQNFVWWILLGGLFIAAIYAFGHCVTTPQQAFTRAGKRSKTFWLLLTGGGLLVSFLSLPINGGGRLMLLSLAAAVTVIIYLSDVRPAIAVYRRRGGNGRPGGTGGPSGYGGGPRQPGTW